jgi:Arc/MetJ family transcription regulator
MPNITLAIDEELLESARKYAEQKGTTVNALVRDLLGEEVTRERRIAEARKGLLELMQTSTARLGKDYKWNREEIYEDRMLPRHERPAVRGFHED